MGNPLTIANGIIPYGASPVYVEGQGISVATLQAAVQAGTVAVQPDITPPNLSLVVFPTGPTQENPIKFRWLAIDETSSNTLEGEPPQVIQYSYYLQGHDATWSPWSAGTFVDYSQIPAGSYDFQARARDAAGNISSTNHFTLVIGEQPPGPILAPINNQTINELALLTVANSASDPDPTQTLTFALVSAPGGVNLNPSTGLLTWTPTEAQGPGTHVITIRVFENASPFLSATQSFNVVVNEVNSAPALAPINNQNINELALLTVANSASDPDLPTQTLTFALVSAPSGVNLNPTTGLLTWTPTEIEGPGTHVVTLRVFDNGSPSLSATQSFDVVVNEVNSAPTLAPIGNQTVNEKALLTVANSAGDPDLPPQTLTFALVSAPNGVNVDPGTGLLTWSPTESQGPGAHVITLRVFDNGSPSLSATQSFTAFVTEVNVTPLRFITSDTSVSNGVFRVQVTGGGNQGSIVIEYSNALPLPETAYVTGNTPGPVRNDYTGFAGMRIGVGASPITVTALGRMFAAGNSGTHIIKLVNAVNGTDVPGGSVSLTMSGGTAGQFKYAPLGSPVVLAAGATYYVVSQETAGGDFWHDYNTTVTTTSVATELSGVYGPGGGVWTPIGSAAQMFGPVDFKYSSTLLQWTPMFTNSAAGGTFEFSDPGIGSSPSRFYRAKEVP
jgi:hypothetical protein